MSRAALLLFVTAALSGCNAWLDVKNKHFRCSLDAGDDPCPGTDKNRWRCNYTWGRCFDPDAGIAAPCSNDDECGGGWRCATDGVCVNPAAEQTPTALSSLPATELIHPVLLPEGELRAAEIATSSAGRSTRRASSVAWRDDGGVVTWLLFEDESLGDVTLTTYRVLQDTVRSPDFAPAAVLGADGGFRHVMWSNGQGRLRAAATSIEDDPLVQLVDGDAGYVNRFSSFRVAGQPSVEPSWLAAWTANGEVELRSAAGGGRYAPPGFANRSVSAVACEVGPVRAVFSGNGGVQLINLDQDFGTDAGSFRIGDVGSVRFTAVGGVWFAVWPQDGGLVWTRVGGLCSPAGPQNVELVPACPAPGLRLVDYTLLGSEQPIPSRECASLDGTEHVTFVGDSPRPLPAPRRIVAASTESYSFYDFGLISHGEPTKVDQVALTLPMPPETVFRRPDGGLELWSRSARFVATDLGALSFFRSPNPENIVATSMQAGEELIVMRDGTIAQPGDGALRIIAYPSQSWKDPETPVLAAPVRLPDGGGVLALAHDDWIDVAEQAADRAELVPRLRPSPGFPISSLALQPVADGGVAAGYAVVGSDLFAIRAGTTRRWEASKVSLRGAPPVHVFFDGSRPRAITDEGRVIGLTARVALTPPTPDPVIAATSACNAPFVLTVDGLYTLVPKDGGAGWSRMQLEGLSNEQRAWDFSGARLFSTRGEVVLVSREGITWRFQVCRE